MKKIFISILVLSAFAILPLTSNAQCKTFAKKICKLELLPYVHDGIYNATVLSEGETAELFKTFYSGQEYRLAVCGAEELPPIEFQVLDADRNVLFDNTKNGYTNIWDFKLESSQMLIISIQVQTTDELSDEILSGCVALLIGFMNVENSFDQF
ncbi:MAG: hypothetical protein Kow0068_17850 [Marinilabiliales bacterium]